MNYKVKLLKTRSGFSPYDEEEIFVDFNPETYIPSKQKRARISPKEIGLALKRIFKLDKESKDGGFKKLC